jgi:hypothetical protein
MVRVSVADQHGIDRFGREVPEQPREDRVSGIDEEPEPLCSTR